MAFPCVSLQNTLAAANGAPIVYP